MGFLVSFNNAIFRKVCLSHLSLFTILYISIGFCPFAWFSAFVFNYTNLFECFFF